MSENNEKKEKQPKKGKMNGEKKFYLFTAIGCAVALIAILAVAIAVSNNGKVEQPSVNNPPPVEQPKEDEPVIEVPKEDEPVVVVPEGMTLPLDSVAVSNDFGFYHNQTLNSYYEHKGVDFSAAAGTEVKAVDEGTVERIYKDDLLSGTEIVIDHGDGVKSVYRFVSEKEGLKVGDKVSRGQVIATVAEATGDEYKEGAHLHFEILENGKQVDPTLHLTLEEK